jgi:hypothetical protein
MARLHFSTALFLAAFAALAFVACVSDDPHTIVPSLGTGGGGVACGGPSDCPGADSTCRTRTCESFVCGFFDAPIGTPCAESGGIVCDGKGSCVTSGCIDGVKNGYETDVDCGGPDCFACENGSTCIKDEDCVSNFCDEGTCAGCAGDDCAPYLCIDGACSSSCRGAEDCVPTAFCEGNACIAKKPNGETCGHPSECVSGFCADGVCCTTACEGGCESCDGAEVGTCATLAEGAAGSPSCNPYVCDGVSATCPESCSGNEECVSGAFCSAGGACVGTQPNGSSCTTNGECASGNCVDGYCCNTACTGSCDACNVSGSLGTCTVSPAGSPGDPSCSPYLCSGASASCATTCFSEANCVSGYYCNGNTCALKQSNGSLCSTNNQCTSGFCVDGYCCNNGCAGACNACNLSSSLGTCTLMPAGSAGSPSCSPYACSGSSASCPSSCTNNAQCLAGFTCSGGSCIPAPMCPSCTDDCDGIPATGCETNICTHHNHCSACNSPCSASQYCNNTTCAACPSGQRDCDLNGANGCETTVNTNPLNCGSCGTTCGSDATCGCVSGSCSGGTIYFSEDFSDNAKSWTLEGEWSIGPTAISGGQQQGNGDPANDHSPSADNGVAGIVLGGNYSVQPHAAHYLVSPSINLNSVAGTVNLSFWRLLNCDYQPYVTAKVEVWNGSSWVTLWQNSTNQLTADAAWTRFEFDVTAYKNNAFKVRFGHQVDTSGMFLAWVMSGWNIDDVTLASGTCQ